jgi:DnaD/phage-associated family protein
MTVEDLSDIAAIPVEDVCNGLETFQQQGMIHKDGDTYVVTNWNKRQFISDDVTARVKKHRQKAKNDGENDGETLQERSSNVSVTPPEYRDQSTEIKDPTTTGDNDARALHAAYEQLFGRLPNKVQIDDLMEYRNKGMELSLIVRALKTARLNSGGVPYALKILQRQYDAGIRTVAQAEREEAERQVAVTMTVKGGRGRGTHRTSPAENDDWSRIEANFFRGRQV